VPPKKTKNLNPETKRYIFVSLFLFIWIVTFLDEKSSTLWDYLSMWLNELFWS